MGRLRKISQSLKAAAFQNSSGRSSPVNNVPSDAPEDNFPTKEASKEVPTVTRETSSLSVNDPPSTSHRRVKSESRPASQFYEPPTMGIPTTNSDHIQELQPVFSFLSSHQNKLYQEGYFLKLNDLDIHGKPNADRNWVECFAQLVGTVLSLWDAAALDAAGQDGEVAPTFINLADASIKMIETLPTRNQNVQPLQNVLSVSTAGKNRYLLHFNSLHSLTQWTAGIRLSMFENASLQEVYTGSLIAGKGKHLNNIRTIMEKSRYREEDWCRVRFGAGTPWRRCWYVIEPPDEKEWQKASKSLKKKSAYDRPAYPKGDLKFYDTRKTKKATPIATISDVYSAYAVYPQSKPLIEQSTLVKLEGRITIHSKPESKTEGFVFVMPETHPAVSGFEMLLRFLFPIYDTFSLYGRPSRLIADTLDSRGLMFAMPKDRRYGYLDIIDVAGLIHTNGSDTWHEREWRKQLKDLIARRMSMSAAEPGRTSNVENARRSLGSRPGGIRFNDAASVASADQINQSTDAVFATPKKTYTAPIAAQSMPSVPLAKGHYRSASESVSMASSGKRRQQREFVPSRLSIDQELNEEPAVITPPTPPAHRAPYKNASTHETELIESNNSSDSDLHHHVDPEDVTQDLPVSQQPPTPVPAPMFQHQPNEEPVRRPRDRPDLRRENSRMSSATLSQLVDAQKSSGGNGEAGAAAAAAWKANGRYEDHGRGVNANPEHDENETNSSRKAMNIDAIQDDSSRSVKTMSQTPPRTASEHSVKRKPLPSPIGSAAFTTDTNPAVSHNPFFNTHERDSSPDYASTKSEEVKVEKPRKLGGVRKTVGDPNFDHNKPVADVPVVDFGVTERLTPNSSRPGTSGGVSPLPQQSRNSSATQTPQEDKQSYFVQTNSVSPHSRSPSQIWQPGSIPAGKQSLNAVSAEEFVQQRAAAARVSPGYLSRRTASGGKIEEAAAPLPSPKKLQKKNTSRPSSRASMLDYSGSSLSAREQEHVARVTGGPLLNIPDRSKNPDPNVGLIGAIESREQEKRQAREGLSNQAVEAEIVRRQQVAYAQQVALMQSQNVQPGHIYAQPGNAFSQSYGPWNQQHGRYQPQQYPQQPPQHQQYINQQAANGNPQRGSYYGQNGGYGR